MQGSKSLQTIPEVKPFHIRTDGVLANDLFPTQKRKRKEEKAINIHSIIDTMALLYVTNNMGLLWL